MHSPLFSFAFFAVMSSPGIEEIEEIKEEEECGGTPCEWEEFGEQVLESKRQQKEEEGGGAAGVIQDSLNGQIVGHNVVRKALYCLFTYLNKYGQYGIGGTGFLFPIA